MIVVIVSVITVIVIVTVVIVTVVIVIVVIVIVVIVKVTLVTYASRRRWPLRTSWSKPAWTVLRSLVFVIDSCFCLFLSLVVFQVVFVMFVKFLLSLSLLCPERAALRGNSLGARYDR